jgi:phosphoribosylanthranilate isomerase
MNTRPLTIVEERRKRPLHLTGARKLLSAVSVLVVAQPSSEFPEGLMNYLVLSVVQIWHSALTLVAKIKRTSCRP